MLVYEVYDFSKGTRLTLPVEKYRIATRERTFIPVVTRAKTSFYQKFGKIANGYYSSGMYSLLHYHRQQRETKIHFKDHSRDTKMSRRPRLFTTIRLGENSLFLPELSKISYFFNITKTRPFYDELEDFSLKLSIYGGSDRKVKFLKILKRDYLAEYFWDYMVTILIILGLICLKCYLIRREKKTKEFFKIYDKEVLYKLQKQKEQEKANTKKRLIY